MGHSRGGSTRMGPARKQPHNNTRKTRIKKSEATPEDAQLARVLRLFRPAASRIPQQR